MGTATTAVPRITAREWRPERCGVCGDEREREWALAAITRTERTPKGWTVECRTASLRSIARPTRWVTLCSCAAWEDE